jgi:hypothetical protein
MTNAEIPNENVLRDIVAATVPAAGHEALRAALVGRYPGLEWRVADSSETWFRPGKQVFDSTHNLVAEDRKAWIGNLLDTNGGDVNRVWERHRGKGYAILTEEGHTVFAGAAIGPNPEDAVEAKIDWIVGGRAEAIFTSERPRVASDLLDPAGCWEEPEWQARIAPRYDVRWMNVISCKLNEAEQLEQARRQEFVRTHRIWLSRVSMDSSGRSHPPQEKSVLDVYPNYLRHTLAARRFVTDWAEASAGPTPILSHWAFDVSDYEYGGIRHLGLTPRPLTWGDEIDWQEERSIYQLMDLLEEFDAAAGYPMAWFFHSVYGNRLGYSTIRDVNEGLRRRKISLPNHDVEVIWRWTASEYGF